MVRTLKDSFWSLIKCVTYRQEKDEKLLKFLVLFSWQALLLCPQKLFWFCRYAVASLGSIYLPSANSICFRFAQTRYDINPRSRSEHIECVSTYRTRQRISKIRFSGFISTRSVLKGTTHKASGLFCTHFHSAILIDDIWSEAELRVRYCAPFLDF